MPAEASPQASSAAFHLQRSLRHCLSRAAELLYESGHVLETITLPQRGLSRHELNTLRQQQTGWGMCQQVLEESGAATYNSYGRWVLTGMGRELMFDMFGQGAADCA